MSDERSPLEWLRRQIEADLDRYQWVLAQDPGPVAFEEEQLAGARDGAADCEAKLAILGRCAALLPDDRKAEGLLRRPRRLGDPGARVTVHIAYGDDRFGPMPPPAGTGFTVAEGGWTVTGPQEPVRRGVVISCSDDPEARQYSLELEVEGRYPEDEAGMTEATTWYTQNRYYCPLSTCFWACDEPVAVKDAQPPDGGFFSALDALQFRLGAVEKAVRAHLETHALLEWVTEISRMSGVMATVASDLGDGGQIGSFIRAATAPGSPVAAARLACLERLEADRKAT